MHQDDHRKQALPLDRLRERGLRLILAGAIGILVAIAAVGFFETVIGAESIWAEPLGHSLDFAPPRYSMRVGIALVGAALLSGQLLRRLHDRRPHGPADLIESAQTGKAMNLGDGFRSSLIALINLCGGATIGLFGPLVHLGGCLGDWLHKALRYLPRATVLGAGAGAAIASVFSAPLGGTLFAHEAVIRRFGAVGPGPVLVCCFLAFWVSNQLLGQHRLFQITTAVELNIETLAIALGVGFASGLLSALYIYWITEGPRWLAVNRIPLAIRPLVPALILFAISPWLPHLLGAGITGTDLAMAGTLSLGLMLALLIGKLVMTGLCLSFGFFGGVFGPALFLGAMLGGMFDVALQPVIGQDTAFVVLGAASCVASVIGAPFASIVIQISRALVGRSLFDRQLESQGIVMPDAEKR